MTTKEAIQWDAFSACACVEGFDNKEHSQEDTVSAWQFLIDQNLVWSLQGWYGRMAQSLIEQGICTPPRSAEKARA